MWHVFSWLADDDDSGRGHAGDVTRRSRRPAGRVIRDARGYTCLADPHGHE